MDLYKWIIVIRALQIINWSAFYSVILIKMVVSINSKLWGPTVLTKKFEPRVDHKLFFKDRKEYISKTLSLLKYCILSILLKQMIKRTTYNFSFLTLYTREKYVCLACHQPSNTNYLPEWNVLIQFPLLFIRIFIIRNKYAYWSCFHWHFPAA